MKILILRFSSIGDIVLTTPVVRCIKEQLPKSEIHFATKKQFESVIKFNPYIDKVHLLDNDFSSFASKLKHEKFEFIVDLHNNIRTLRLKSVLRTKSKSFDKLNYKKWLTVRKKDKSYMPDIHIVDRYMDTVAKLGVKNDGKGLDYYPGEIHFPEEILKLTEKPFIAVAVGGSFFTKRMPVDKLSELLAKSSLPLILLGDKNDSERAEEIISILKDKEVHNLCGILSINQSAAIVQKCEKLITHDTGLMHIGAAFDKIIISIWGNTIPEFGMYPYFPKGSKSEELSQILEVENLYCRPCSKLGFDHCPEGHFRCMRDIDFSNVKL